VGSTYNVTHLWENQPNRRLLQNDIESRKVDIIITEVGSQFFNFVVQQSSLLSQHSGKILRSKYG